jgi:pilus assembly protein CpaE
VHDFVLVDTPPGIDETTAAAIDVANLALLVTTPEASSLRRAEACLSLLDEWDLPADKVKLLLNRASSRTRIKDADIEALVGYPVWRRLPNDYAAIVGSARGRPVVLDQPRSALASSIRHIATQLVGQPESPQGAWARWRWRTPAAVPA